MPTTLLITVIGPQRRVDLEVPGEQPIWDLLSELLTICITSPLSPASQSPAMWGLGRSEATSFFDARQSLLALGVVDGEVLQLQRIEAWATRRSQQDVDPALHGVVKRWNKDGLTYPTPTRPQRPAS